MVQKCGYEPLVVDSGDAAVALLTAPDAQAIDAVVLDLVMPVGSSFNKRDEYYRIMQPQISKVYTPADALLLSMGNAHDGPWEESEFRSE